MQNILNKHGPRDGPFLFVQRSADSPEPVEGFSVQRWVKSTQHSERSTQWDSTHYCVPALRFALRAPLLYAMRPAPSAMLLRSPHSALRIPWVRTPHSALRIPWVTTQYGGPAPRYAFVAPSPPLPKSRLCEIADGYSSMSHLEYPADDRLNSPPGACILDGEPHKEFWESEKVCLFRSPHSALSTQWEKSHSALRIPHSVSSTQHSALSTQWEKLHSAFRSPWDTTHYCVPASRSALCPMLYAFQTSTKKDPRQAPSAQRLALCLEHRTLNKEQRTKNPKPFGSRLSAISYQWVSLLFPLRPMLYALCNSQIKYQEGSSPRAQRPAPCDYAVRIPHSVGYYSLLCFRFALCSMLYATRTKNQKQRTKNPKPRTKNQIIMSPFKRQTNAKRQTPN